jgi:DNA-binding GntR family transcriptional regulator
MSDDNLAPAPSTDDRGGWAPGFDESLADRVYRIMRRRITDGQLSPGDPLPEEAISHDLGVSRTPVRQALNRLQTENFLSRTGSRGKLVVKSLTPEEIQDTYAVRAVLEGMAVRLAAQRFAEQSRPALAVAMERLKEAAEQNDHNGVLAASYDLHHRIWHLSGNPVLERHLEDLQINGQLWTQGTVGMPNRLDEGVLEHQRIFDAIAARDPDLAETAARDHLVRSVDLRLRGLERVNARSRSWSDR